MLTFVNTFNYNLGQNIVDKFTKISKINFSMEYFIVDLLQCSSKTVKIYLWEVGWKLTINFKHFKDFRKISI